MNYSTYTNEELVSIIAAGDEAAYEQLFRNLAPITLHEAEMYRGKMDTYSTEDFLQEGNIVAWEIISRGNFKDGKFSTYFGGAIRKRLIRIWRDYNLKNLVCIGESEDCRGTSPASWSRATTPRDTGRRRRNSRNAGTRRKRPPNRQRKRSRR